MFVLVSRLGRGGERRSRLADLADKLSARVTAHDDRVRPLDDESIDEWVEEPT
jgi:hypothetical protein